MTTMSLRSFIQQQASEPQEVLAMSVREFLNAIATQCEDTCTAVVTLDAPEPNSISVKFFQPGVEKAEPGALTDQHENLSPTFELSVGAGGDPGLRGVPGLVVALSHLAFAPAPPTHPVPDPDSRS